MLKAIVVHGGAVDSGLSDAEKEANVAGVRRAALAGWGVLCAGAGALDAVEAAIRVLEDDPSFDAGRGSYLNAECRVETDASIMDGATLNTGAVAAVQQVKNPITLARRVLESDWALLVGDGALQFARQEGVELCSQWDLLAEGELDRWRTRAGQVMYYMRDGALYREILSKATDTVGAVALDGEGNIAAGTSTGGPPNKPPGRVGDSPLIGCGTYADNDKGGAGMTGPGEMTIRLVLAKHAVDLINERTRAQAAAEAALRLLKERTNSVGGIIVIDRWGGVGRAHTTSYMASAYMTEGLEEPVVET
jgi:L-asparaginase / beta-aspartyl-peptidase